MAFYPFERFIAWRYFGSRRKEGVLSLISALSSLGIALGVATLIIVLSVMNGYRAQFLDLILGFKGHVTVFDVKGGIDPFAWQTRFDDLPEIKKIVPVIDREVLFSRQGETQGVLVRGLNGDDFRTLPLLGQNIVMGDLKDFHDNAVIIGQRLAERFGLAVGDDVTLISPQGDVTAFGMMPRSGRFEIAAITKMGMYEYDSRFVFMPLPMAQKFFRYQNTVGQLELHIDNPDQATALTEKLVERLPPNLRLYDWQQSNASFINALKVERNVMFIILILIILIASFNIISNLTLFVKDKKREIAILRTIGATRAMIMRTFFFNGMVLGGMGTLFGFLLGIAFCQNIEAIRHLIESLTGAELFSAEIYFLSQLPAKIDWFEILVVVGTSLTISFLATLYPAWRAARLDPVEALRDE